MNAFDRLGRIVAGVVIAIASAMPRLCLKNIIQWSPSHPVEWIIATLPLNALWVVGAVFGGYVTLTRRKDF